VANDCTRIDASARAEGLQLVIATHSPILLAYPRNRILSFGADGIAETQ
jgi:predicted ATPase